MLKSNPLFRLARLTALLLQVVALQAYLLSRLKARKTRLNPGSRTRNGRAP